MNTNKIVACYCRSASAANDDSSQIDRQRSESQELAKEHQLSIERFYIDEGVSGLTLNRPEFERLIQDCKNGEIGTVLISDIARIARDRTLVEVALGIFQHLGVQVLVCAKS